MIARFRRGDGTTDAEDEGRAQLAILQRVTDRIVAQTTENARDARALAARARLAIEQGEGK